MPASTDHHCWGRPCNLVNLLHAAAPQCKPKPKLLQLCKDTVQVQGFHGLRCQGMLDLFLKLACMH